MISAVEPDEPASKFQQRDNALGTLRNQLKTIYAKTGTRHQAELVALLLHYAPIAL